MPRAHRNHATAEFAAAVDTLRMDVVATCGFDIKTTKECALLQQLMQQHDARFTLGISTLRRFFHLLPSDNSFSVTTLNSLARYAGKSGFQHYTNLIADRLIAANQVHWDVLAVQHFALPEPPDWATMMDRIDATPFSQVSGLFLQQFAQRTVEAYARGLTAAETRRVFSSKRCRRLVMEILPPLSWIGGFGKEMFEQYLEHASTEEERLYALGVLSMSALFTGDLIEARTLVEGVEARTTGMVHILPSTRILGLQWLFAALDNDREGMDAIWAKMDDGYRLKSQHSTAYSPDWEIYFCDMSARFLLLSRKAYHLEKHLHCLRSLRERPLLQVESNHLFPLLDLHEVWILCRLQRLEEATEHFANLHPTGQLPFDWAFGQIVYHALGEILQPDQAEHHRTEGDRLVAATGFTWLSEQLRRSV